MRWIPAAASAFLLFAAGSAGATWILPPEAPLDRLLANTEKRLKKSPDDPHVHYLVARLHAMAYANPDGGKGAVRATANAEDGGLDYPAPFDSVRVHLEKGIDADRLRHLREAIRHYRLAAANADTKAAAGRSEAGLSLYGRGWILEDAGRFAAEAGDPEGAEPKDGLDEKEGVAVEARIRALAAEGEKERRSAEEALLGSLDRAWPRIFAHRGDGSPAQRAAVARLLARRWSDLALADFRAAHGLVIADALASEWKDVMAVDRVALQAGEAVEGILRARGLTDAAREEIAGYARERERIEKKNPGPITPILFPVDGPATLASLLPAGRSALFDLDGDLVPERWPWPSARAGILVWAPDPAKPVVSGRQMIGGRTWWVAWRDGYEPLEALDGDGSGRLEGDELEGLAVWRDLDGDGRSGPGEVRSARDFGIAWIAAAAAGTEDGVPANRLGISMADGTTRPTFDWTPSPIR